MPLTVITLKNVPPSLKGDLTKWMQEISTGVYVGNFNTKVREQLWQRVRESAGVGEATMSYATRNEIGYQFETHNSTRIPIDYDGIPLIMIPKEYKVEGSKLNSGFSDAAKFRKAKKHTNQVERSESTSYVVLDIETDGLNPKEHSIIEIGAVKVQGANHAEFHSFVAYDNKLPPEIIRLTGITESVLEQGERIDVAIESLLAFLGDFAIIGYNIAFDISFINEVLKRLSYKPLTNSIYDMQKYVKREQPFLSNYKLETVLEAYGIDKHVPHRALEDARLIYELSTKVNEFHKKFKLNSLS